MKTWQILLFGILLGLLAAALVLIVSTPPRGNEIKLIQSTSVPITIQIDGGVKNPGIYQLPLDSRLDDAMIAAGGLLESADSRPINLARKLTDGERITIPTQCVNCTPFPTESTNLKNKAELQPGTKININSANVDELQKIPGIGPSKANAIIKYRETNGPYKEIQELDDVPGIGPAMIGQMEPWVSIE
jgi:competence protein ComEA